MVFSGLFGKKKEKEAAERSRSRSGASRSGHTSSSIGRNSGDPTTVTRSGPITTPPNLSPREVARATAEKIDKIESEMSRDLGKRSGTPAPADASKNSSASRSNASRPSHLRSSVTTLNSVGQTTDIMLGDSILANAMELSDAVNPALEEAAILYANGQDFPALAVLADAVRTDRGTHTWLMLLELYQALGKKQDFENLAIDYAVHFETSAPAWSEDSTRKPAAAKPQSSASRAAVVFKGALDGRIMPQLEQLKKLAQKNPVLHLEFGQVTSVDAAGADLILRVFAAFQKSNHEVALRGAEHLATKLLAALEVGRRDESNAVWMLLLEIYRVLGRQAAFEETSIDYCVTYEVSPPSWEPASPKYRLDEAPVVPAAAAAPAIEEGPLPADAISLSGELVGKIDADMARLTNFAAQRNRVVIDCARLVRVDFTAAGVLLNWSVGSRGAGKTIEFVHVGHLVAALFVVMGLHEVVLIERRKV